MTKKAKEVTDELGGRLAPAAEGVAAVAGYLGFQSFVWFVLLA